MHTFNLNLCAFLFRVLNIYCLFSNTEPKGNSTCLNEGYLTHIFSTQDTSVFLQLGTPNSTPVLCLGATLNSEITKSTKMWKKVALNRSKKGHLFTVWQLQSCPVLPELQHAPQQLKSSHSAHVYKSPQNHHEIDFRVTNKFYK